jgi:hypothetical protein
MGGMHACAVAVFQTVFPQRSACNHIELKAYFRINIMHLKPQTPYVPPPVMPGGNTTLCSCKCPCSNSV